MINPIFSKLDDVVKKYNSLETQLADPSLATNPNKFRELSKEHSDLQELVETFIEYRSATTEMESNKALLEDSDEEMRTMAKEEMGRLTAQVHLLEEKLKVLLLPRDPNDDKNILLEIRAGAGGDESALFAAELFRMYKMYADALGWKVEVLNASPIGIGGFKEIIMSITGEKVFSRLKFEGGVHRVQRVPKTETSGRIHTSTVTVAVMPEADEVSVNINPSDLKIDVYRSGGPGGQSVNTTDSAVRITHIPTGLVVACQDEKSQHKNKAKALKILRARIYDAEIEKAQKEHSDTRKSMIGTGDRSERIRTYNFPQSRLTDHRIGLTVHSLPQIMEGHIGEVLDALITHNQAVLLETQGSNG